MERTDETLSTRDLASPAQEPAAEAEPTGQDARGAEAERAADDAGGAEPRRAADAAGGAEPRRAPEDADMAREDGGEPVETAASVDEAGSLLPEGEEGDFLRRWEEIQTRFVDDPRQAVEDADTLVASVMQRIAEGFAQARDGLEGQWSAGGDVGTEELRVALQRYRLFFRRLLSA
jgi:hypothetical protein